jgi:hypothetical protein
MNYHATMKKRPPLTVVFTLVLLLIGCSQKQFAFRKTLPVESQAANLSKRNQSKQVPIKDLMMQEAPSPMAQVLPITELKTNSGIAKEQTNQLHVVPQKKVEPIVYTDSIPAKKLQENGAESPHLKNLNLLAVLGIVSGLIGLIVSGLIMGSIGILLGFITLKMAEKYNKRKTLPLIAIAVGIIVVFLTLTVIAAVL